MAFTATFIATDATVTTDAKLNSISATNLVETVYSNIMIKEYGSLGLTIPTSLLTAAQTSAFLGAELGYPLANFLPGTYVGVFSREKKTATSASNSLTFTATSYTP
jgi:hypothetical protein